MFSLILKRTSTVLFLHFSTFLFFLLFLLLSLVPLPSYPSKIIHVTSIRINRANASFPFSKALKILSWLLRLHFFIKSFYSFNTIYFCCFVSICLFCCFGSICLFWPEFLFDGKYLSLKMVCSFTCYPWQIVHSDVLIILHDLHGQKYDDFRMISGNFLKHFCIKIVFTSCYMRL